MEKIQPGKFVELGYKLYEIGADGKETLVHETDTQDPERFVFGVTPGMIKPLESAIEGLEKGGKFDIKVKAADAFGEYDPEQIAQLPKDIFEIDGKFDDEMIKKGAIVPMMTADGYRINGVVLDVTPDTVSMDFNHPLAGKDVRFDGEILLVRDATPEELHPTCGGCGCGDNGCGCDETCDCESKHHDNGTCGCGCN